MKVVVTGASGFLGGSLCRALLKHGHHVRALVRRTSDLSNLASPSSTPTFELAYGDVTDYCSLLPAFYGCQVIFHAAAAVAAWLPDPSTFYSVNFLYSSSVQRERNGDDITHPLSIEVNVGGLKNVIQAAKETLTVKKIIFTSSIAAFGPTDGYIGDESQVHSVKFFCTEYERSKVAADKIVMEAATEGVPILALYPGIIYGVGKLSAGNGFGLMLIARFNGFLPAYIGRGEDKISYCYVDDVAEAHVAAMDKGRIGEKYLLTGENASCNHLLDLAASITKTKRPSFTIPLWVLEAFGWLSLFFFQLTGKHPFITPEVVLSLKHQWTFLCEKAQKELDYNPRSLKEGLETMLPWLKNKGLIKY